MKLLIRRPSRWVGLALLWLLGSLAGYPVAATSLIVKPTPASIARITQGNINRLEYFVDADPGLGNGTAVPLTPGADVSGISFTVNLAALTAGFHRLSTRAQDANGVWSLTTARSFYYQSASTTPLPPANITRAEYFIDAEPGLDNGTNIPIAAPATDVSGLAFTVDLTTLTAGFHRLTTRSRDANGAWSLSNTRSFYYKPASATPPAPANITRIEYYFDADPGFGSATSVPVPTPAPGVANAGFAVDLSALPDGAHRLFIRSRDANGKWSLVSSSAFTRSGCASSPNFAASLPTASYAGTNTSGTLSSAASVAGAFNTDPAVPTTSNAPYFLTAGTLQADLGTAQTISEVRVRLTASGGTNSTTIQIQTAASTAGPFTTIDTYVAPLVANMPLLVARKFATPVSARVLRLQLQNSNTSNYIVVSGTGIFNFQCVTPSITSLMPNSGPVGTSLTVTGANLQGTSVLTFAGPSNNTVTTGFAVSADGTQLTGVVVPAGAITGNLTATTPNGTSNGVGFTVSAQPSLTSIAPASGVAGTAVTLNGANLSGATTITFAGTSNNIVTTGFVVNSAGTQLTGVVVPGGAITGNVAVTTPVGTSNGVAFTVTPAPVVSFFSPASGPVGTSVTVTGANLSGTSAVAFNGTTAPGYAVNVAGTQLTVAVPMGASTGPITITASGGTATSATSFTVTAAPVISAFSPAYVQPGDALTITGQNLLGLTKLQIGGAVQPTFTVNATGTQLMTTVPGASYVVNGTPYPLTSRLIAVTTPGGTAASATKLRIFNVTGYYDGAQGYATPPSQVQGGLYRLRTGDQVFVRGSGFLGATGAAFVAGTSTGCGSTMPLAATPTILNDSMLYVPFQYNLAGNGFFTTGVSITTSLGSQTPGYSGNTYFFNPQIDSPFASCLSPTSGPAGTRVTVTGSWSFGGNSATGLSFNGVAGQNFAANTSGTQQTVSADLPAGLSPGTIAVRVTGSGSGFASATDPSVVLLFTLTASTGPPAPALSSLSAASGPVGTSLAITGTNLTGASSITFAGTSNNTVSTGFTVNAAGMQITGVIVPTGAQTGDVTVTTPGGSSNGLAFTVIAAPVLTSFTPASGPISTSVVLSGQNLSGTSAVAFNGTAAVGYTVNSAGTQLTVAVPTGASTGPVTITTPGGTATSAISFTVTVPTALAITGTTPAANAPSASAGGAVTVTFNQAVSSGSAAALKVFSAQRGGLRSVSSGATTATGSTVSFAPTYGLQPGETMQATITTVATAATGGALAAPRVLQFVAAAGSGPGTFSGGSDPTVGGAPYLVRTADLNGDGSLDLLTINNADNTVSIRLNNGAGVFSGPASVGVVGTPWGLATGDVNNDGLLDFVVTGGAGGLSVRLNSGGGTFLGATNLTVGSSLRGIVLSDVDGDGDLDLLTEDAGTNRVLVLLNDGRGTFSGGGSVAVGTNPQGIAVADVDQDGDLDLLTANYGSNTVSVRLNNGSGTFSGGSDVAVGVGPGGVAAVDIDGDGDADLLSADQTSNSVSVRLNNGSGTFSGSTAVRVGTGPVRVSMGDVDGDGDLDLLTANIGANTVSVRLNDGSGGFSGGTEVGVGNTPREVVVADVDGDGDLDLLSANFGTNTVSVRLNQASALPDLVISTGTLASPTLVAAGTYHSVTVTGTGVAQLTGSTVVTTSVVVAGTLDTNCQSLTGAASFTLAAGGTLGICDPLGLSTTAGQGAIQTIGTHTFSPDASYLYNGSAAQMTGDALPEHVRNLSTTNNNPVTLTAPVAVVQVVTVGGTGNLVLNGQALTLLSGSAGTALVVNSGLGVVQGPTGTMQRYLDPSKNPGRGYRHYSAPVSGSTVNDLTTSGYSPEVSQSTAYNASPTPGAVTPFPTVFGYDQSRLASVVNNFGAFDKGFVAPTSLRDPLLVGRGYALQLDASQLVDFVGQLTSGDVPLMLARNPAGSPDAAEAGWQLVGNPYPAPLDFSLVAPADRLNLDASMYVFESSSSYAGNYRSYVNGIGNPLVGSSQGFFVRVSSGQTTGSLTFRNGQRLTSYATQAAVLRQTADARPLVQLTLRADTGTGATDVLYAYAEAGATPDFDPQYDAVKLPNTTGLNLASLATTGEALAIDGRPVFAANTVLPLTVGVPAAGSYTLTAAALHNLPPTLDAYLSDAATGQTVNLRQQPGYSFNVNLAQAATLQAGRFTLRFGTQSALATLPALTAAGVTLYPNPAHAAFTVGVPAVAGATHVQAELLNTLGQVVLRQTAPLAAAGATLTFDATGLATGIYLLRLQAGAGLVTKRVVID